MRVLQGAPRPVYTGPKIAIEELDCAQPYQLDCFFILMSVQTFPPVIRREWEMPKSERKPHVVDAKMCLLVDW